jgi:hypothetical protein
MREGATTFRMSHPCYSGGTGAFSYQFSVAIYILILISVTYLSFFGLRETFF